MWAHKHVKSMQDASIPKPFKNTFKTQLLKTVYQQLLTIGLGGLMVYEG